MQDFDTLRNRVEETAQKLTSVQGERQGQTESLIGILRQLEERYAAQEQQVAYYRDRVEPLEQANEQLSLLMGNLLDLIDNGFGEDSLAPMRKASEMAAAMLSTEMTVAPQEPAEPETPVEELEIEEAVAAEPETDLPVESDVEPNAEVGADSSAGLSPEEVLELIEAESETKSKTETESEPAAEADVAIESDGEYDAVSEAQEPVAAPADEESVGQEEEFAGPISVATDLEMEEEALMNLEEDIDPAAEEVTPPAVFEEDMVAADDVSQLEFEEPVAQASDVSETPSDEEAITIDEIVSDAEMTEIAAAAEVDEGATFEDVSSATLELESEEDAATAMEDLPEIVQIAAAAAQNPESEMGDVPEAVALQNMETAEGATANDVVGAVEDAGEPAMSAGELGITESTADEAEAIAAIAQAIEDETSDENAPPPAPADIRSLLLRVEALAKKAEAMRQAQGASLDGEEPAESAAAVAEEPEASPEDGQKQAGAAA